MTLGESLDQAGWRQGSVVKVADISNMGIEVPVDCRLIVISQDCDIICRNDNDEPNVEVMLMSVLESADGNFTHNKNPRKLHLTFQTLSGDVPYSLTQLQKQYIQKSRFVGIAPDKDIILSEMGVTVMATWLASRYSRAAFPNTFDARIAEVKKAKEKIKGAAIKVSEMVSGIHLEITPLKDIDVHEKYQVNLLALVLASESADEGVLNRPEIKEPIEAIAAILRQANMDVVVSIQFESAVPYSMVRRRFKPWTLDYVSYTQTPHHETP